MELDEFKVLIEHYARLPRDGSPVVCAKLAASLLTHARLVLAARLRDNSCAPTVLMHSCDGWGTDITQMVICG